MKAIDIMHRMLNHMSVIITDILKQQLNQQNETKVVIENQRKYLLQQATHINSWIQEFDPQNVNFDNLKLPSSLQDYSRKLTKPRNNDQRSFKTLDVSPKQKHEWFNQQSFEPESLRSSHALQNRGFGRDQLKLLQTSQQKLLPLSVSQSMDKMPKTVSGSRNMNIEQVRLGRTIDGTDSGEILMKRYDDEDK